MDHQKGKVYLIGAGPGDPGLITIKAVECLKRADVVVYDFLANPALLAHASPQTKMEYVGKKSSDHTLPQKEINRLLVDLARSGKIVARLKGGDPFVFGRGGEEAEELFDAGIPFEIIPGVTSAIAAPAYAGIPVTHRRYTANLGFITGHEDPGKTESSLDWRKIATGFGTLVFLMGIKNLANITANLISGGRSADTPAAVVRWGTTPDQVTLVGTLTDIAQKAKERGIQAPAVLIVGEVVCLRDKLNWFETLPLFGRRILVTRTRAQASSLVHDLSALGAWPVECPTIRIVPPSDWTRVDHAINNIAGYNWLILTSPNGVDYFFERVRALHRDTRSLAGVKVAAIGPATAEKLAQHGLTPDLVPTDFVAEGLIQALTAIGIAGDRILLARAEEAREVLPEELAKAGAQVDVVALYQPVPPEDLPPHALEAIERQALDLAAFTSSSTVTNLVRVLGPRWDGFAAAIPAACIGPITSQTARECGLKVVIEAKKYTVPGLVEAMIEYFAGQSDHAGK
ncbi:MAG: uroporphyrinogen-III C-methyltransferase [Deltaproteobacteria bacterium]|nr:uroporphyrinogen-III C-methyltransferase [Deltaproteobacteria bacterium]